jgi:hypothetical protein
VKIVYELIDPLTKIPFYVGKGNITRPQEHFNLICAGKKSSSLRLSLFLKKMKADGRTPIANIVAENLSNADALQKETDLILKYGRIDYEEHGVLLNHRVTQNDWTGRHHSTETRLKISESKKGQVPSEKDAHRLKTMNLGRKHPPRSDSWKEKQRQSQTGRTDPPETFQKKSIAQAGEKNPRAKKWILEDVSGQTFLVVSLKTWCAVNKISYNALAHTRHNKKFCSGFRVVS